MTPSHPTLHIFCGMIAAGKSTLARELAVAPGHVLIDMDHWVATLYQDEITGMQDYFTYWSRLRKLLGPHMATLLEGGMSVVLDCAANTVELRRWLKDIADGAGADHQLHLLEADDELCRARMHRRNAEGSHEFAPDDAAYDVIRQYFSLPGEEEGLTVIRHPQSGG